MLKKLLVTLMLLCAAASAQTFTVLHSFKGGLDGVEPMSGVTLDQNGTIWGTTYQGGSKLNAGGGVVYGINTVAPYKETILTRFTTRDGRYPYAGVTLDGVTLGTASQGGANHTGVVYAIDNSTKLVTVLHSFPRGQISSGPQQPVVLDTTGNLWGSYQAGIFELTSQGFTLQVPGISVTSPLLPDGQGGFYGTSTTELFHLDTQGSLNVVYRYSMAERNRFPMGQIQIDQNGVLYGAFSGSGSDYGGIYSVTNGTLTVLYNFTGKTDGGYPFGGLTLGIDGLTLYGTAMNIFQFQGGALAVLHNFNAPKDGYRPLGSVLQDSNGVLYGTASQGGIYSRGTVWAVSK